MGTTSQWIEKHLWAILAVAMGLYGGYLTGQATTNARLDAAEKAIVDTNARQDKFEGYVKEKMGGRFGFMNDAAAIVNFMCQSDPNCSVKFAPIRVPE